VLPSRASGFVHRRDSVIAERFGQGPLTEPTAGFARSSECLLSSRLRPNKASEGKLDGGKGDEVAKVSARFSKSFGETPISSEPGEGVLDHPAARQDDKGLHVVAPLDDIHAQYWHPRGRE
jgi:hypothetical protein